MVICMRNGIASIEYGGRIPGLKNTNAPVAIGHDNSRIEIYITYHRQKNKYE